MSQTHRKEYIAVGKAIAAEMPEGWEYVTPPTDRDVWWAEIRRADGATVTLQGAEREDRWHIHGSWPKDGNRAMSAREWNVVGYNESPPSISVTRAKTPAQIARDIERRFLPEYLPLYAKAVEKQKEKNQARDVQQQTADKLADTMGLPAKKPQWGPDDADLTISMYNVFGDSYGEITIGYNGSVDFRIRSVSATMAPKIAEALRVLIEKGGAS